MEDACTCVLCFWGRLLFLLLLSTMGLQQFVSLSLIVALIKIKGSNCVWPGLYFCLSFLLQLLPFLHHHFAYRGLIYLLWSNCLRVESLYLWHHSSLILIFCLPEHDLSTDYICCYTFENRKECSLSFPRRVFVPWLAGTHICDYLQSSETLEVRTSNLMSKISSCIVCCNEN